MTDLYNKLRLARQQLMHLYGQCVTSNKADRDHSKNMLEGEVAELELELETMSKQCKHKNAYHFHDNAPMWCPDCDSYVDGGVVVCSGG